MSIPRRFALALLFVPLSSATAQQRIEPQMTIHGPLVPHQIAFSPDGKQLAAAYDSGEIVLWDPATQKRVGTLKGHGTAAYSVRYTPDGKSLVSGSGDRTVRVWDLATGKNTQTLLGHTGWVRSVSISPDGSLIASASYDRTVRIWELASGKELYVLKGHRDQVQTVAFSPDGKSVASADDRGDIILWDPDTGKIVRSMIGGFQIYSLAWCSDGKAIVTGDALNRVRIWDAGKGLMKAELGVHDSFVLCAASDPKGTLVATCGGDSRIKIWDVENRTCVLTIPIPLRASMECLCFSPDGKTLASAISVGPLHTWKVPEPKK